MDAAGLQRIWYGGAAVPGWLSALVPVYRLLRWLHRMPYRLGWRRATRLPVPILVVGNLTAGGSGKTPLVIALVEALHARGWRPGVVSRGYGGRTRTPRLLDAHPDPAEVGDEPALIRRRTAVPVAVGRDRAAAAQLLLAEGVDVVIADDGLQNPALARDLEICVIDGERRFGNGRLLPAGPLREPLTRLATLPWRVCNGGTAQSGEVPMRLHGDRAVNLATGQVQPLADFAGHAVHAIAGIGHPERFFAALRARGIDVQAHPFPDHHAYVPSDLAFGDGLPVLMTEKDAIKCAAFAADLQWSVPVDAELPGDFVDALTSALASARAR
ncbi:MAG TPA: tetraacyldisaccharide 4'-kinase [Dokdonella sp.]|uniref:tetraacyldisaccharide 4'-kinase n=1 Tax=Dokdonella sp. TaxID=2291710 RepID=UPI002B625A43|nr:tetraacyldisaccharide 4'-kinase [Dokdonella sp.]HUD42622.1 tetraacyldisaccharide 4'-kinase [Dokdonella sp.]